MGFVNDATAWLATAAGDAGAWIGGIDAEVWTASAAWVTAGIAATAGVYAKGQLREARTLREEQAAPYVVAFAEASPVDMGIIELIVRNLGHTAATDIHISVEPPLTSALMDRAPRVPEVIPVLVPGQEFRMLWDSAYLRGDLKHRAESEEPGAADARVRLAAIQGQHEVQVTFLDHRGARSAPFRFVLDWDVVAPGGVTVYGVHHAAKALREIGQATKKWTEGTSLRVLTRDGHAKDEADRAWLEQIQADEAKRRREGPPAP